MLWSNSVIHTMFHKITNTNISLFSSSYQDLAKIILAYYTFHTGNEIHLYSLLNEFLLHTDIEEDLKLYSAITATIPSDIYRRE